jgi:putative peptide zinc metalloprotease protein
MSQRFAGLFNRNIACLATTVSCVLIGIWFWNLNVSGLDPWSKGAGYGLTLSESVLMYVLILASFMFHEFGHAAASRHYAARPAEIGFGLYLIFPVFYCNVTDIWRLPRLQRIVVSLGGVYFQLIASAVLVPFSLATDSRTLNLVIAGNLVAMLATLNPFFRFDGYWVYSDFFSIPNLRKRAEEMNAATLRSLFGGKASPEKAPNALRLYAAGSAIFFSGFAVLAAGATWKSFAAVPGQLDAAIKVFGDDRGWEMALNIAAASTTYVIFLAGCLLTFCYTIATVIRALRMLLQTAFVQDIVEPRSTPHV